MSPRNRSKENRGLEPNLYVSKINGKSYYYYRRPDNKKSFSMGTSKADANEAARQLNSRFMKGGELVAKVTGSNSVKGVIDKFKEAMVDNDPEIAERTKKEKCYRLSAIAKGLGHLPVFTIETRHIVEFLSSFERDAYRQHRSVLKQLFDYAITQGLITLNPVNPTQPRIKGTKKLRPRLTVEQYKAIREIAPEWFRVAMDLALVMCIGRYEVAALKFSNEKKGRLRYVRKKTEKYDSARISVEITPSLREILTRAKALPPLSQHVVAKPGHGPVSPEMLTRWFNKLAKQALGELSAYPTMHEIRALGSHLLEAVEKRELSDIQHLMAHSNEKQTKEYTDGHGEKWVEAVAGKTVLW